MYNVFIIAGVIKKYHNKENILYTSPCQSSQLHELNKKKEFPTMNSFEKMQNNKPT